MQRFNFSLLQTFHSRKCDGIFAKSVIEVGVQFQNLKVCFGFFVDTRKYIGKNNVQGDGSIMSNEVILNFMSCDSIII